MGPAYHKGDPFLGVPGVTLESDVHALMPPRFSCVPDAGGAIDANHVREDAREDANGCGL